jgi:two-component system OmpR family response regulator
MARVLLVDDDPDGRDIRTLLLEHAGHQVVAAADTLGARARFGECIPDCVILDLRVPECEDGLALIRDFRRAAPGVRIVILAGHIADLDGRAESRLVDDVLAKPVRSERLLSVVRTIAKPA